MQKIIFFKEKADAKICFFSILYVTSLLANLAMGYRYIALGSLTQSGGIFIFPFSFIISDIITEVYGSELARKQVLYGIFCQLIFALYAAFVIRLPAPNFLHNKEQYYMVFYPYLNFALASTFSIWIGSKINIFLLSRLSEYVGGKYFALRSLLASTVGELLVTCISMCLANFNKMSLNDLLYMIICCFTVKTIISLVAIWPAALIVQSIEQPKSFYETISIKNLLNPISFVKHLFAMAWNAKGYVYNLESINLESQKVNLYFKGTRGVVVIALQNLILDLSIISKMKASDTAHLGYYYATFGNANSLENKCSSSNYQLHRGIFNIKAICRDNRILIEDGKNALLFKKFPIEIYKNQNIIDNFSPSQSLYIGYLAGLSEFMRIDSPPKKVAYLQRIK